MRRVLVITVIACFLANLAYAAQLQVCVKHSGAMYLIGPEYRRTECKLADTPLALNTEGPQGPVGPQGPEGSIPCATVSGTDVFFTGCNVHIVNGEESTDDFNGLGNLIIGYNEASPENDRSGSHNLVIGRYHTYSNYGGLLAGESNVITGAHASITAGRYNYASGDGSSIAGGLANYASGAYSSISGGADNGTDGETSYIGGGHNNWTTTPSYGSSILGGLANQTSSWYQTIPELP